MMKTGLLGASLKHSFSPQIHKALDNDDYELFEIEERNLEPFLRRKDIRALNVTIPYKERVMPYLADCSSKARAIGAVNTMIRLQDGQWYGDNTDYDGFSTLLDDADIDVGDAVCLVLGAGGTAKTVHAVLSDRGAREIRHIVRHDGIPYSDLPLQKDTHIIVNTTPVGMHPNCPDSLIDLDLFPSLKGVCDVIYNPLRTKLLLDARERSIPCAGGLIMLITQGVVADALFFDKPIETSHIQRLTVDLALKQENIVIIGMPGVGKTTVGQLLAKELSRPFVDLDDMFSQRWGDVANYIHTYGESAFREKEQHLIQEYGLCHGHVIACGGGIVTRKENLYPLKQNSRLYLLHRDLEHLPTSGRPLSSGGMSQLKKLFEERQEAYELFSDCTVENLTPKSAVNAIKEDFYAVSRFKRS